ncbi:hypothetical protein GCM10028795_17060 [Lysobacter olei]
MLSRVTLGRSPESDLFLDEGGISRQHARLRPLDCGLEVEDLGSTNGTFINGHRITLGIACVGDEIAFDQVRFRLDAKRETRPSDTAEASPVDHPAPAKQHWIDTITGLFLGRKDRAR